MNSCIKAFAIAVVLYTPVVSFAQSTGPVTRAEVENQLAQLEKAGYNPTADLPTYPRNLEAAEARVAAKNRSISDVGGTVSGTSESGAH